MYRTSHWGRKHRTAHYDKKYIEDLTEVPTV